MSAGEIDREGIGMLYAAGAGMATAASLAHFAEPSLGWVGGAILIALGLGYEVHQRRVHPKEEK